MCPKVSLALLDYFFSFIFGWVQISCKRKQSGLAMPDYPKVVNEVLRWPWPGGALKFVKCTYILKVSVVQNLLY